MSGPTAARTWKSYEYRIAKMFGGTRNPLSGMNSKHTAADMIHPRLFLECKMRARVPFMKTFTQTKQLAQKEGKMPMVVFKEKFLKTSIIMMDLDDFMQLVDEEKIKP